LHISYKAECFFAFSFSSPKIILLEKILAFIIVFAGFFEVGAKRKIRENQSGNESD